MKAVQSSMAWLKANGFNVRFTPAEDDSVDSDIEIRKPGVTDYYLSIQIGAGYVCLNRYTENPWTMEILQEFDGVAAAARHAMQLMRGS